MFHNRIEVATTAALLMALAGGLTWSSPVGACSPVEPGCTEGVLGLQAGAVSLISGDPDAIAPPTAETGILVLDADGMPTSLELDDGTVVHLVQP